MYASGLPQQPRGLVRPPNYAGSAVAVDLLSLGSCALATCNNLQLKTLLPLQEAAKEHDSCINNLHTALSDIGLSLTDDPDHYPPPAPFNLWMAVSLTNNGTELSWDPPAKVRP